MFSQVVVDEDPDPVAKSESVGRVGDNIGLRGVRLSSDAVHAGVALFSFTLAFILALVLILAVSRRASARAPPTFTTIASLSVEVEAQKLANLATVGVPGG